MEEKLLNKLLRELKERDWYDFKRSLKLYRSNGKLAEKQRDELVKDILGLANGNSHIIRRTKYLIIGVDDKKIDENGCRILYEVDYRTPSQSELIKILNSASSPAITGIDCKKIAFNDRHLLVISILLTFDLHAITRELRTPQQFPKFTVFMRQDENTTPASVRDGVASDSSFSGITYV